MSLQSTVTPAEIIIPQENSEQISVRQYYEILNGEADSPAILTMLRRLMRENPNFDRPYLTLFEQLISQKQKAAAKTLFMSRRSEGIGFDQWILAKIYAIEDSASLAFEAFAEAVRINKGRNLRLSTEFIDLAFQNKKLTSWMAAQSPRMSKINRTLFSALADFVQARYERTLSGIHDLHKNYTDDAELIDIKGYCQYKLRRLGDAQSTFRDGLSRARIAGDKYYEALFLMRMAMVAFAQKRDDDAAEAYEKSLALARRIQSLSLVSKIAGNRGGFHFSKGRYPEALQSYSEALRAAEMVGRHNETASWYFGLGLTLRSTQEFERALIALDNAMFYSTRSQANNLLIQAHLEKGNLFTGLGLNSYAVKEYEEAYELAKSLNRADEHLRAFGGIAAILIAEKKFEKARKILQELAQAAPSKARSVDLVYWRYKIADSFFLENRLQLALQAFEEVLHFANQLADSDYLRYVRASALLKVAQIQILAGSLKEASAQLNDKFLRAMAGQREDIELEISHLLGNLAAKNNQFKEARLHYARALDLFERERDTIGIDQFRIGYFDKGAELIDAMITGLASQFEATQDPEVLAALVGYLETNSARVLKEMRYRRENGARLKSDRKADYDHASSKLRRLQKMIRLNPRSSETVIEIYEALRYDLLSKRLTLADDSIAEGRLPQLNPESILAYLDSANLNLLYYHFSGDKAFALTANGNRFLLTKLNTQTTQIASLVDSLLAPLQAAGSDDTQGISFRADVAHTLYDRLFRPIENNIDSEKRVLIVPNAAIKGLPFELLLTQKAPKSAYRLSDKSDYLNHLMVNLYTISYSPALSVSMGKNRDIARNPKILVLANPLSQGAAINEEYAVFGPFGWQTRPLWFSDLEAEGIKSVHANTRVYKRNDATKVIFAREAPKYDIIHLATHAFVDTAFDAFSGLVLAMSQDTLDDGLLMGHEISDLSLSSDLVTLSACDTGRGRTVVGEGLLGLPRLFLAAGANSVIMTLWKVDDKFASLLMPKFYDYLLNKNLSKTEALKLAKQDMLNHKNGEDVYPYQHPFYWSAFTLYGDPGIEQSETWAGRHGAAVILTLGFFLIALIFRGLRTRR